MIQFFDINTRELYNGDYPYIHWTEPFSTGVIRYKSLYFISDRPTHNVTINKPDNWNFALCPDLIRTDVFKYDGENFADINNIAVGSLVLTGHACGDGTYAHQLIIICRSDVEGEFIEQFEISGVPYKIGAQFWGENEAIKINLANQGTEIPAIINRAIYGSDQYEEDIDWVLINRKFRELLINHMDIMDNKGSYKSLFNALKWFEYENLVELREVWKFNTPDGTKYYDHKIDSFITEEARTRMFNSAKTTYFALRHLRRQVTVSPAGSPTFHNTIYEKDSLDDRVVTPEQLACMWSENDMRLKMVLLGNFFEKYFMPIHTELIRACVEDIHIWEQNGGGFGAVDSWIDEIYTEANDFEFNWQDPIDPDNPDNPEGPYKTPTYSLGEIHAYAGLPQDDAYGQVFENNEPLEIGEFDFNQIPIVSCHDMNDPNAISILSSANALQRMQAQYYNGIGCIVGANFEFKEPIKSGTLESNQWGQFIKTSFSINSNFKSKFSLKFLFPFAGTFVFIFNFKGISGRVYSRIANITIENNLQIDVSFYALVAAVQYGQEQPNPFATLPETQFSLQINHDSDYSTGKFGDDVYGPYGTEYDEDISRYFYNLILSGNAKVPYIQFLPMSAGGNSWKLPYKERMYTWVARNGTAASRIITSYKLDAKAWYTKTTLSNNYVQIRAISKIRGNYLSPSSIINPTDIIDSDISDEFFPELHKLTSVPQNIYRGFPIICQPVVILKNEDKVLPYSNLISGQPYWEFFSYSLVRNINESITGIRDIPIAWQYSVPIPKGKYKIIFRYKFGTEETEIIKMPRFTIVDDPTAEPQY